MDYTLKQQSPAAVRQGLMIIGAYEDLSLTTAATELDKAHHGIFSAYLKTGDFKGKIGDSQLFYNLPEATTKNLATKNSAVRVLLMGCGKREQLSLADIRKIYRAAAQKAAKLAITHAHNYLTELSTEHDDAQTVLRAAMIASAEALYRFEEYKSEKNKSTLQKYTFASLTKPSAAQQQGLDEALAISKGMALTRDLSNLPPNICHPSYLAQRAQQLQKHYSKQLKVQVLSEAEMKKLGMGAFLAVSQGSAQPGKLIVMEYQGTSKTRKPIVLVGKGITFDTGGISLKPGPAMDEMKFDMCGAASVFGTMVACCEMGIGLNVVGIIAAAENMPSGAATRPGDIVRTMNGTTVEILNTDAEGRLVLCDALSYVERFKPDTVIDIATLTGACVIALGKVASGVLGNDQALIDSLLDAGQRSGDRLWQLPLWDEYKKQLKSPFADLANIGGRDAGTITAAAFLAHFTEKYRWAHLDIAGTAWHSGNDKGATGRPVPLLTQYLLDRVHDHPTKS
ncbi:MAG: leucyl aminopeptidase [Gammaproteobacteria bacterium]|nr:leucyl aminopeptidase [Gammaproteobacteria bacterium]